MRFIFEHYAAGESAMSIVEQLNAKGLRTSQGNPFNKSSIPRIIQNEAYRGALKEPFRPLSTMNFGRGHKPC